MDPVIGRCSTYLHKCCYEVGQKSHGELQDLEECEGDEGGRGVKDVSLIGQDVRREGHQRHLSDGKEHRNDVYLLPCSLNYTTLKNS